MAPGNLRLCGLDTFQVKITSEGTDWWGQHTEQNVLTAYTHHDRLGSIVNLTDKYGRNLARADYQEYGEIAFYESITVSGGYRRIAPQLVYTNHEWDDVLDLYYAKARFYDPAEKRFLSTDPVKGTVIAPQTLVPYVYCVDNPLKYTDPLGQWTFQIGAQASAALGILVGLGRSIAIDGEGNIGIVLQGNIGGGTPDLSVGGVAVFTNAPTVDNLGGVSYGAGGSIGFGVTVGLDFSYFNDGEGHDYSAVALSVTAGPIPAELHAQISGALVISVNLGWLYDLVYSEMRSYFNVLSCEEKHSIGAEMGIDIRRL